MKKLFVIITAVMLMATLTLGSVAESGAEELDRLVDSMDADACYADRLALYGQAMDIYDGLGDEDKLAAADSYARLLAEGEALSALSVRAEAFLALVAEMDDCISIHDKANIVNSALKEDTVFRDGSYPGITKALDKIDGVLLSVEASMAFIDAVGELMNIDIEDYAEITYYLNLANSYKHNVDVTYQGVSMADSAYGDIKSEIQKREAHTAEFVSIAMELELYPTYRDKKLVLAELERYMADEEFEDECNGVDEAMAMIKAARDYMQEAIYASNGFILAVEAIDWVNAPFEGMLAAYLLFVSIDTTVDGISDTLDSFENAVDSYNDGVKLINQINSNL